MLGEQNSRGGNLYNPNVLQGNWLEDRLQKTIGTNDGLRAADTDYSKSIKNAQIRKFEADVSVPEFSGERTTCSIAPATRYARLPKPDTTRVLPDFGVEQKDRFQTTAQLMQENIGKSLYVDPTKYKKSLISAETFRHAVPQGQNNENLNQLDESANLMERQQQRQRQADIESREKRYWETTSRSTYKHPAVLANTVVENPERAGFTYDDSVRGDALPFPDKVADVKNDWGLTTNAFKGHPSEHHIRTSTRMFVDYRGQDPPRLGITSPLDGEGPPLPLPSLPGSRQKNDFRRTNNDARGADIDRKPGYRIWQDSDA